MEINRVESLSVGIDVGSSTSHLIFSKLTLIKDEHSPTQRFVIRERDIVYEGEIVSTPLLNGDAIDVDALTTFLKNEFKKAGIRPSEIKTGAVIVTGETARKCNAPQIAQALSHDAGRFVAATAGPNFESLLAAMGSGAVARSHDLNKTILSCDIGGGTANLAISKNGEVISTSCVSVGGRLISLDSEGRINRLNRPAVTVMEHLGLKYATGDFIPETDLRMVSSSLADVLIEVMIGPARLPLAKQLMVTDDLAFRNQIDEYLFSGGVAEFIYGGNGTYHDIGKMLADAIQSRTHQLKAPVVEPLNKIRATVIGAGSYSLSISGCSGFMDTTLSFPIRNVPVLRVDVEETQLSIGHVISRINSAYQRYDFSEGEETVALFFKDPVKVNYNDLMVFAKSLEAALPNSINNKKPVILIFEKDIACSVGNVIKRETRLNSNLLSLDELSLEDGDWIDIGEPLVGQQVFPVTIKSLVFPGNRNGG
ncbi:MAG TPA: ethanolamine ammonia-lyase reactivating factor EutA [Thermodesulfobacteriota bacterium]|mgnify:FL=1|nr:ethanolamine ammonia-lyase reactivating factor EutA [Deltaproteobacteria bacterium]HQO77672.1 ethanolamine ammonia-lyase reactivating factor EutA [Thermodesulfobacteriota bacterium]